MPSAALRLQYRADYFDFKAMCAELQVDPVQAIYKGAIIASWLAGFANADRPAERGRAAWAAVQHYRWLISRDAFVDAVLSTLEFIEASRHGDDGGDDGGGKELDGGKEAPAEPAALPTPLAAEPSQD